jgi:hypothetical protein
MLGGLAILCIGLVLLVFPGPGLVFIAAGALMIASESRQTASFFDRCEVRARIAMLRCRRLYRSRQ